MIQSELEGFEIVLVFENYALASAGATVVASSSAPPSAEPLMDHLTENLLLEDLSRAWRSGDVAEVKDEEVSVDWSLGESRSVDWVSFHRSNIRTPIKVELYRDPPTSGASPLFASDWIDPIVRGAVDDFTFDDFIFTLGPDELDLAIATSLYRLDSFVSCPLTHGVRYVRARFDVGKGSNGDSSFLQFALPMISKAFRPEINILLDWSSGVSDRSVTRRLESGAKRGRRRTSTRDLSFDLGYLTRDEAFRRLYSGWARKAGVLGMAFAWPEPSFRAYFYDQAILGQLVAPPKPTMARLDLPGAVRGLTLEEAD
jgi:hypothetical protein